MPTDTIYGIVGLALNPKTVEEIYSLRKRTTDKPMIILISSIEDLQKFDIKVTKAQTDFLKKVWPNPVSVILPCPKEEFKFLHRNKKSLAFRMPCSKMLLNILAKVGPLVAPSANFEDSKPAETIAEAKKYFGDKVSFYVNDGRVRSEPSTLVQLSGDGSYKILRQGSCKLV